MKRPNDIATHGRPSRPFTEAAVAARFDSYPAEVLPAMLGLRELIFETAANTVGVGDLQETLRWGEPAYLTAQSKSGTTIRIDWKAKVPDQYAMYFHCQTGLVDSFRIMFPTSFRFEGNRALIFGIDEKPPTEALELCIEAALTYHARKKAPKTAG